jgi:hypothetical protein
MTTGVNGGSADSDAIRKALGRLCTRGVAPWWVREKAEVLIRLRCVAARARESANADGEVDEVESLVEILRELVESIDNKPHKRILRIVLDLDRQYTALTAGQRRAVAGREFRGGDHPVTAETIRQVHEKAALDRLTIMLVAFDKKFCESVRVDAAGASAG